MKDPTREEMLATIDNLSLDVIDRESAIYWFASDYHGGQWSNLYSVLSTSPFKPGPSHTSVEDEGEMAVTAYDAIVGEFG